MGLAQESSWAGAGALVAPRTGGLLTSDGGQGSGAGTPSSGPEADQQSPPQHSDCGPALGRCGGLAPGSEGHPGARGPTRLPSGTEAAPAKRGREPRRPLHCRRASGGIPCRHSHRGGRKARRTVSPPKRRKLRPARPATERSWAAAKAALEPGPRTPSPGSHPRTTVGRGGVWGLRDPPGPPGGRSRGSPVN